MNENVGSAAIVVQVTPATHQDTITVNYATSDGTAKAGLDYFATSGTLTFGPNESAKLVQVAIIDDLISEPSETFNFALSDPINAILGQNQATITINDNDGSADGINVIEFNSADYGTVETLGPGRPPAAITFVLTAQRRGDPNQSLTVELDVGQPGDTAVNGVDYTAPATQTVTFPPGIDQVNVTVPVIDRPYEAQGNTFFTTILTNPGPFTSVGQQAVARATIFDNSGPNTVQLLTNSIRVQEGAQASITIPVFRTGSYNPTGSTNVNFTTEIRAGDTAQPEVNFTATSGTNTFNAITVLGTIVDNDHQGFITIFIPDNTLFQGDVTFHVTLTSSDVAQLGPISTTQVTMGDNDSGNVLQFSSANYSVSEAGPYASVTVKLTPNGNPTQPTLVDFAATSITAYGGFDFSPITATLVFQPNEFSKTVLVPIFEDAITESPGTFRVTLSNPSLGSVLGVQSTAIVTIVDDDLANIVQFSPADYSVAENAGPVTLTVVVNRANHPDDTITVHYNTVSNTETAGKDFVGIASGTLVFAGGETQKTITVTITDDALIEGAENFFVVLTDATSVTFDYATSDGTAIAGVNYVSSSGSITFAVGEVSKVIQIPIIDDPTPDPTLTFTVTLTAADGTGFVGGRSTATVNIIDNDATTFRFNPAT